MSRGARAVTRLGLIATALVVFAPRRVNAQASGVLQAMVRVIPGASDPAVRALSAYARAAASSGTSKSVELPSATARVELQILRASSADRPPRLRATVTYLR